jgi:putative flippase GtrA
MLPRSWNASPRLDVVLLIVRFGVVGLLNTAFVYAIFALLVTTGVWSGVALILSAVIGVAFNFQTTRRLVFRSRGRGVRFAAIYGVLILLDWTCLRAMRATGWPELHAQATLALPFAAVSFLSLRAFVFDEMAAS